MFAGGTIWLLSHGQVEVGNGVARTMPSPSTTFNVQHRYGHLLLLRLREGIPHSSHRCVSTFACLGLGARLPPIALAKKMVAKRQV